MAPSPERLPTFRLLDKPCRWTDLNQQLLVLTSGDSAQLVDPRQRASSPKLCRRFQLSSLEQSSHAQCSQAHCRVASGKQRRPTFGTKHLQAHRAALSGASVLFHLSNHPQAAGNNRNHNPKRATGERLAISAMAHIHPAGIDLGSQVHRAAVAAALDVFDLRRHRFAH